MVTLCIFNKFKQIKNNILVFNTKKIKIMVNYFRFKNYKTRFNTNVKSFNIYVLQHLLYNEKVSDHVRIKTMLKLQMLRKGGYQSHFNKRCLRSLKNRTVNLVSVSKSYFKFFLNKKVLTGFTKASW